MWCVLFDEFPRTKDDKDSAYCTSITSFGILSFKFPGLFGATSNEKIARQCQTLGKEHLVVERFYCYRNWNKTQCHAVRNRSPFLSIMSFRTQMPKRIHVMWRLLIFVFIGLGNLCYYWISKLGSYLDVSFVFRSPSWFRSFNIFIEIFEFLFGS